MTKRPDGIIPTQQDNRNFLMTGHSAAVTSSELCEGRSFVAKQTTAEILKSTDTESDDCLE